MEMNDATPLMPPHSPLAHERNKVRLFPNTTRINTRIGLYIMYVLRTFE